MPHTTRIRKAGIADTEILRQALKRTLNPKTRYASEYINRMVAHGLPPLKGAYYLAERQNKLLGFVYGNTL